MSAPENPAAFPYPPLPELRQDVGMTCERIIQHAEAGSPGMSMRDWYAGRCPFTFEQSATLYGMPLRDILCDSDHSRGFLVVDADVRFAWADAMLTARATPPTKGGTP